jgi:hypothetical protein
MGYLIIQQNSRVGLPILIFSGSRIYKIYLIL